jgi:hypothetical protein
MSIGFQKLNGAGTAAFDQLVKLGELIQKVEELNYPEIYKMAKMFAPNMVLVPLKKTWNIDDGRNDGTINLDGRYFGIFQITHNITRVAGGNNTYEVSRVYVYDINDQKVSLLNGFHGDDILAMKTLTFDYTGFGTSIHLRHNFTAPEHSLNVSFIGFRLEELPDFTFTVNNNSGASIRLDDGLTSELIHNGSFLSLTRPLGTVYTITSLSEAGYSVLGANYTSEGPYSVTPTTDFSVEVNEKVEKVANFNLAPYSAYFEISVDGGEFVDLTATVNYGESYSLRTKPLLSYYTGTLPLSNGADVVWPALAVLDNLIVVGETSPFYNNPVALTIYEAAQVPLTGLTLIMETFNDDISNPIGGDSLVAVHGLGIALSPPSDEPLGSLSTLYYEHYIDLEVKTMARDFESTVKVNGVVYSNPQILIGPDGYYINRFLLNYADLVTATEVRVQEVNIEGA